MRNPNLALSDKTGRSASRELRTRSLWWGSIPSLCALLACCTPSSEQQETPRRPLNVGLMDLRGEAVPEGPVSGTIAGNPFRSKNAYYTISRRAGGQRIDLFFLEEEHEHCGLPGASSSLSGPTVWIRIPGRTSLAPGELTAELAGENTMQAHYEVQQEGHWTGVGIGRSVGLLSIATIQEDIVHGHLLVCFDDGVESCVRGRFRAGECRSEVDLNPAGERFSNSEREAEER